MTIDLWTIAIVWEACALISMTMWAKEFHHITLADVGNFLMLGPLLLLIDLVISLNRRAGKVQLWKAEE